jgi:hypothetical protein
MEFVRTGKFKSDALETLIEIEAPLDRANRITLRRLDHLLETVGESGSDTLAAYANNLNAHYQNLIASDLIAMKSIDLAGLIVKRQFLEDKLELARSILNYHLQILSLPESKDWQKSGFKLAQRKVLRSVLVPAYYNLQILIETIGRKKAFKLYKRFITQYTRARQTADNQYENVREVMESRLKPVQEPSEWVMVHGILEDGKYAYKNENCLWIDALADFPDADIKYFACCYGDFQGAKIWNEHFVLTMEHTIAQGDPYCSRVVHDTRVDWHLQHPKREFWENM